MGARHAIVQSVFECAIREINVLEGRIVETEDGADALLWKQAGQVVAQLEAGLSQRQLAAQWINVRTEKPHSQMHVSFTARVYSEKFTFQPRPRFRDAYNGIANASKPHISQNSGNNEWYTPVAFVEAARSVLGAIDLDPASSEQANTVVKAARFFTRDEDGLVQPWDGRVWMNPPYAQPLIAKFCEKLADSVRAGTVSAAVVLVNNATETAWFTTLVTVASALCFPEGRIRFLPGNDKAVTADLVSTPLQGSAVIYVGRAVDRFRECFRPFGEVWFR